MAGQILHATNPDEIRLHHRWLRNNRSKLEALLAASDPRRSPREIPHLAFCLLEELPTGSQSRGVLLTKAQSSEGIAHQVTILTVRGEPTSESQFQVQLGANVSDRLRWDVSADTLRRVLESFPGMSPGDFVVGLGRVIDPDDEETEFVLGRWLIEWAQKFEEIDPPLLSVVDLTGDDCVIDAQPGYMLQATDTVVTIRNVIPTDTSNEDGSFTTTPLHRGSIGQAKWVHGVGYVVDAIECRHFEPKPTAPEPY